MAVIWNTSCKKCILWDKTSNYISFQDMQSFFEFLVSVINHYHINGLYLFWVSFEWFCLKIRSDTKYFPLSCLRDCDQELIVVIVYYFQIWNKKEHTIIINSVISCHMGPIYIEILYITMNTETPYIYIFIYWVSRNNRAVTWVPCVLTYPVVICLRTFKWFQVINL